MIPKNLLIPSHDAVKSGGLGGVKKGSGFTGLGSFCQTESKCGPDQKYGQQKDPTGVKSFC